MFEGKDNAIIINYKSSSPLPAIKIPNTQIMKQERYECGPLTISISLRFS